MDLIKRVTKKEGQRAIKLLKRGWKKERVKFIEKNIPNEIADGIYKLPDYDHKNMEELKRSCFMYGKVGVGKTTEACRYMLQYHKERFFTAEWERYSEHSILLTPKVLNYKFTSLVRFYMNINDTFSNNQLSVKQVYDNYKNVDFLIIDDIGKDKPTDWSFTMFSELINDRHNDKKITIITSNLSLKRLALEKYIDDRVKRRLGYYKKLLVPHYNEKN